MTMTCMKWIRGNPRTSLLVSRPAVRKRWMMDIATMAKRALHRKGAGLDTAAAAEPHV